MRAAVGDRWVSTERRDLIVYGYDATGEVFLPDAVCQPGDAGQVAAVVAACHRFRVPLIARGAGTNISGGTLPERGGLVLNLGRMKRVLRIDTADRIAVVEPGCTNLALQEALAPHGFFYAPDPSSHRVSTVGGNAAENAGGPHCVKYGVTSNHVLGLKVVLSDGSLVELGGEVEDAPGFDLPALFVGSEGTLGVTVELTVRILPLPAATRTLLAVFDDLDESAWAVSDIIAARITPAALELMDQTSIQVVNESVPAGYPPDAQAVLIIEVDGSPEQLDRQSEQIAAVCRGRGAREVRSARTEPERDALWLGRRIAYGAMARKSAHIWTQDVTVPRDRLARMLRLVVDIGERYRVRMATVAHAGDGNLHPVIAYDPGDPDEIARMKAADREIVEACVRLGGAVSGEHGIGIDKRPHMELQHGARALGLMWRIKEELDPHGLMNPGKKLPDRVGGF